MASDLSNILKEELTNTLEQLLSQSSQVDCVDKADMSSLSGSSLVEVKIGFDFKEISSSNSFFIPNSTATKFEYLMLGGMGDLKDTVDEETTDAVNEIIANIGGSFATSVNAQNFEDVQQLKSEIKGSAIVTGDSISSQSNCFELIVNLGEEKLPIIIYLDEIIAPFFSSITGVESKTKVPSDMPSNTVVTAPSPSEISMPNINPLNLDLLQNVRLKLSVRLGTKTVLLKDILRWDVGEIIELEQMVNEPLEILVNGIKIGEGEAVIVEGKFGLKVKKIGNKNLELIK